MCFRIFTWIILLAPGGFAQPPGAFTAAGNMTMGRILHTSTLLNDGRVLVAGGTGSNSLSLASAEIYDPSTGAFTPTGSMATSRAGHTATLLPDGKVLIAGGNTSYSAELYDPVSGTFSTAGNLTAGVSTATLLSNGKVLLTGRNLDLSVQDATRLYDPETGDFTGAGNVSIGGEGGEWATLLGNGAVFLGPDGSNGAELYEPATGAFRPTGRTSLKGYILTANLLLNGKVLVTEGAPECDFNGRDAQLYDPATETFSVTGSLLRGRCSATGTSLSDGTVLISGDWGSCTDFPSPEIYDPNSGTFSQTGAMAVASRYGHTATLLKDGRVLIAGGLGVTSTCGDWYPSVAEVYTPSSVAPPPVLLSVSGSGQGAILHASTHQLVSPENPAVAGEALEIYGTGLIDGAVIPPQVAIAARLAEVLFFGRAPGYDKLSQINVRLPSGIASGPQVSVRLNYLRRPSNEVTITVH